MIEPMSHRLGWIGALLVAILVLGDAAPALAWSNGTDGPNAYGTHDLILDHALTLLGAKADWVCLRAALRVTDDPDTKDGIDHASGTWWHVYDIWGTHWGGAPEAVTVWFDRTRKRLAAGKDCAASRALGIMAHMFGDMAQPMHTDSSPKEDSVHSAYEEDVDSRSERTDQVYVFHDDGTDHPTDPFAAAAALAKRSHRFYTRLVDVYAAHGYNRWVNRMTRRQLNRAANALADLIEATDSGTQAVLAGRGLG
jgi:hypothetical protein